jgi:ribulose 1,5-bisphosphate synthetase/thiazole synthase
MPLDIITQPSNMKSELKEFAHRRATTDRYADNLEVDVLIVGAGFGGVYLLYELRTQAGFQFCYIRSRQ